MTAVISFTVGLLIVPAIVLYSAHLEWKHNNKKK